MLWYVACGLDGRWSDDFHELANVKEWVERNRPAIENEKDDCIIWKKEEDGYTIAAIRVSGLWITFD